MAKNLEETQAAFNDLKTAIAEEKQGVVNLITAVEKLMAAIPPSPDLQPLFDAIVTAKEDLLSNNTNVKDILDKANAPTTPPVA